ncbi:hypothetical protein D7B24_003793 [Verticillium nonalfalfae]|uniref:Calponin-homology (CH) domain-containing protein n=1 Tax=Verticillium nonalfalfae TaxID=1051616 RepID=A0A3M9YEH0_9PEZI|nr:uncharacterized protein D7B24_003793 [Verticillium nonalfalfae]RNJ58973.1 hypothetical protein D7B24_003793 [Verticillium nonalfalfae]
MASVSSLDKDLRKLRLDRYTPAAANEVKSWIESTLGERLAPGDLLESLKDGVALCKLVNLALPPPGIKFKQSAMPFVQMENISHFLRACKSPPLNLQEHDVFLTVDLYEQKDPAQVLQCISAFSRAAHGANPARFPSAVGGPKRSSVLSPQSTGPNSPALPARNRGLSTASNGSSAFGAGQQQRPALSSHKTGDSGSGRWSPTKSSPTKPTSPVSSWSRKEHEGATSPAWNIAQYGYLGGASQGNLGISFGGRRQITTAGPSVPSFAEKQRLRREREAEEEQQRLQAEEEHRRRQAEREAEEEQARLDEERRWEEQTQLQREVSRRKAEEEKRKWEEEERQWKMTEEKRRREEEEAEARLATEKNTSRSNSDARLRGQFLSQYNEEQALKPQKTGNERIAELERELEKARERERQYEQERQGRTGQQPRVVEDPKSRARSRSRPAEGSPPMRQDSWSRGEREVLRTAWNQSQEPGPRPVPAARPMAASPTPLAKSPRPLPDIGSAMNNQRGAVSPPPPTLSPRPLPDPAAFAAPAKAKSPKQEHAAIAPPLVVKKNHTGSSRPLPDPAAYTSPSSSSQPPPPQQNRTDKFLGSNPAPEQAAPIQTYSRELGATAEQDGEDRRRAQSQAKTKAGGWASKSLLEREMEMERQRQREWEEAQEETAKAVRSGDGVDGIGGGVGGRWDVGQWSGFTGGDSQNKGGQGIGAGRRQIVGPRPLPGGSRRGT